MKKTAVLITTYNRKATTLQGLDSLKRAIAAVGNDHHFDIFLVDDGSTDGTYESVEHKFPEVHLYKGDGQLYWVHGMLNAWQNAVETDSYDYFLWFNDDNKLYDNALHIMYSSSEANGNQCVIAGAFCDHEGKPSYGGRDHQKVLIVPNGAYQGIDILEGNLVLVPSVVYKTVGMLNPALRHNLGDYDYGFRAQRMGVSVLLTPEYIGINDHHDDGLFKHLHEMPFKARWKMFHDKKHSPVYTYRMLKENKGMAIAVKEVVNQYLSVLFPSYYDFYQSRNNKKWLKPFMALKKRLGKLLR